MIKLTNSGVWLINGQRLIADTKEALAEYAGLGGPALPCKDEGAKGTMAYQILEAHNTSGNMKKLKIRFDALTSHDITYVGIIQTARASGLKEFPVPYVLTNCHNSLCAVGGTINEDDHMFGLSAAKRYGGIYVPPHIGVLHQFMREMQSGCGRMILGSDSHTRYGAFGTMAVGEGGPELVKQILGRTWDNDMPDVIAVCLSGKPAAGVGPHDIALAIIGAVFGNGFVKNKVMEFVGPGVENLSVDCRMSIDAMTTETACLSSIWRTDDKVREFFRVHGRPDAWKRLDPHPAAYYDGAIEIDLAKIKPMIALPFHPSNTYTIEELSANPEDILAKVEADAAAVFGRKVNFTLRDKIVNGKIQIQQGVIAGCAGGTFENIGAVADILSGHSAGNDVFRLSVYPSSQPVNLELTRAGVMAKLMQAGAILHTAFCGPCFGAGDTPANNEFSIRHSTRNFPNREGSKPGEGQIASVALMDARSIAATARNGGILTPATDYDVDYQEREYTFDRSVYENRCWFGFGKAEPNVPLQMGPNITDWPEMQALSDHLMLQVASVILDPVTTTDELIPSGETSSLRSNPLRLSEFALSRRDPGYVGRAKQIQKVEYARLQGLVPDDANIVDALRRAETLCREEVTLQNTGIGSVIYAVMPGDGSAREQAASCQKVLGTFANVAREYATKRYRSNLINWGMLPFVFDQECCFDVGDYLFVPGIRSVIQNKSTTVSAFVLKDKQVLPITLKLAELTDEERMIILEGCLINYYKKEHN